MDFRRRLMAHPCKASSARIFRRSRSRVPWTRSFGLLISVSEMSIQRLLSVSKGNLASGIFSLNALPACCISLFGITASSVCAAQWRQDLLAAESSYYTQKRLQAWIGDACKRRLCRSRPQARCGKQSHCEAKEKNMTRTTIGAGLMAFISCIAFGQPVAHPPAFEVASVKVADGSNTTVAPNGGMMIQRRVGGDPGMIDYKSVTLKFLLARAYGMKEDRISGPEWLGSASYDIMAKKPAVVPHDQTMLMLRALLTERFQLTLHKETKTMPVYALTVAKSGPKLQEIDPAIVAASDAAGRGSQQPPTTGGGRGGAPPMPIGGMNVNMNGRSTQLTGRVT